MRDIQKVKDFVNQTFAAITAEYDNATGCWSVGGHDVVLHVFKKRD